MVRKTGELWGKSPRQIAGNGPACVKAFVGALPTGETGYTFKTEVQASATRHFFGVEGRVWSEDDPGVFEVKGQRGLVGIKVEIIDGESKSQEPAA